MSAWPLKDGIHSFAHMAVIPSPSAKVLSKNMASKNNLFRNHRFLTIIPSPVIFQIKHIQPETPIPRLARRRDGVFTRFFYKKIVGVQRARPFGRGPGAEPRRRLRRTSPPGSVECLSADGGYPGPPISMVLEVEAVCRNKRQQRRYRQNNCKHPCRRTHQPAKPRFPPPNTLPNCL